ncbi:MULTISPECIES: hypothetical protein [unclassified Duganella]|uniref:tyrosine-type recombinase/integrase n=1 Tax=unclassified Duganella TaxID=2636909 RepID=UPI000892D4E7|nr:MULTISPECIES: hypothetical protein [unclassified Duganella]OEZ63904.1 tyrosine recombinase XerC [Duganella sp. HH105]OFA06944.1 tyrosine recombinase XerC [Duganella sp. HH101]
MDDSNLSGCLNGAGAELSRGLPHHDCAHADWAAIATWMSEVAASSPRRSNLTTEAYGYHLAKLRWYCENVTGNVPSKWTAADVKAFENFLADLQPTVLSGRSGHDGLLEQTPFKKRLSATSQSEIMRFTKSMFKALHDTGYIQANPARDIDVRPNHWGGLRRKVSRDQFDIVVGAIDDRPCKTVKDMQLKQRDRFIFICLRETGLSGSEMVEANMDAFQTVTNPDNGNTYWVLSVAKDISRTGVARAIPVSRLLFDAFVAYRAAFGLEGAPHKDSIQHGLVLSVRTTSNMQGRSPADNESEVGATPRTWRSVRSRQGLHEILKGRVKEAVQVLRENGDTEDAAHLANLSAHWLRNTFVLAQIEQKRNVFTFASTLGYASISSIMRYTDPITPDPNVLYERDLRNARSLDLDEFPPLLITSDHVGIEPYD